MPLILQLGVKTFKFSFFFQGANAIKLNLIKKKKLKGFLH